MTEVTRILRGLKFYHKSIVLDFDDITIAVSPETWKYSVSDSDKSFIILFEETEKSLGQDIAVITELNHSNRRMFHPSTISPKESRITDREEWTYKFTSWFPAGSLSLVPSPRVEGKLKTREPLGLKVGKNYQISFKTASYGGKTQ